MGFEVTHCEGDEGSTDLVIALVSDTWCDSVRRGFYSTADQFCLSALDDPRVRRVLIADHPRSPLSRVKGMMRGDEKAPRTPFLRGVRPLSLSPRTPTTEDALRRRYRAYDRQLATSARLNGLHRPILITFNTFHAAFGSHDWAVSTHFYAQDDESAMPGYASVKDLIDTAYRTIATSAADVNAVSDRLLTRISGGGSGGRVISNGVDPSLWATVSGPPVSAPGRRHVAAYAGTIDTRIDVDAVRSMAMAGFDIEMAGPVGDDAVARELKAIPHVTLVGILDRTSVVRMLSSADLCFLAHHRTELTESMSPLKVYEYACSGAPVLATGLQSIRTDNDIANLCTLVGVGDDYGAAALAAVAGGRRSEAERQKIVGHFSWRARHRPLIDAAVEEAVRR